MARYRFSLNLQLFAQEKTEPATPKKRQESRKKGQVAKSMELPAAFIMLGGFALLAMYGHVMGDGVTRMFSATFYEYILWDVTVQNVTLIFAYLLKELLLVTLPIMALSVIMAFLASYIQIGFLFTNETLKMKLEKIDPIQGAKNIFSTRALAEFAKSMIKVVVIGIIVAYILIAEQNTLLTLASVPLETMFQYVAGLTLRLGLIVGAALVIISVFDYMYQRWQHEKSIRMSKQDIKDEYKKTEGDPLIKGKIREKQRQMAMQRMMQEVPRADVVITNPTHFAVAIQYDASRMDAPKVIAKGADYVALRMKRVAAEHGVTLMENKPLARALYAQVEIGETIPNELFQAVAEVLAYVYKLKGREAAK